MKMLPQLTFLGRSSSPAGREAGPFSSLGTPGAHPQLWPAFASFPGELSPKG